MDNRKVRLKATVRVQGGARWTTRREVRTFETTTAGCCRSANGWSAKVILILGHQQSPRPGPRLTRDGASRKKALFPALLLPKEVVSLGVGQTAGGPRRRAPQFADGEPYDVMVADAVVDTRIEAPAAHVARVDPLAKFGEQPSSHSGTNPFSTAWRMFRTTSCQVNPVAPVAVALSNPSRMAAAISSTDRGSK